MSRYFNIKITSGTSVGPYNVYYNAVGLTYATLVSNGSNATGLTYSELTTGNGVLVSVPNNSTRLILYNTLSGCDSDITFVFPTPTPTPTISYTCRQYRIENNTESSIAISYYDCTGNYQSDSNLGSGNQLTFCANQSYGLIDYSSGSLFDVGLCPTPTPTPTPSSTATPTPSPTPTATIDCALDTTVTPELTEVANCLANMEFIVQYSPTLGPCPGGHECNAATFYLRGNNVTIGTVYLSNNGFTDQLNYPPGVTSGLARYNSLTLTTQQAQDIAASSSGGNISFSLVCATPIGVNYGYGFGGCHTNVTWITLKLNNETIYSGCPNNNFLTINPCTGVIS